MTPRQITVLHVVEAFSSGVYEMVRQIAGAQVAAGQQVHIAHAMRPWTPEGFESEFAEGIVFHRLAWGVQRSVPSLLRGTVQLRAVVRQVRPTIVHLHSTLAGLAGAVVRPRHVPSIYTPNGYVFLMSSLPVPARRAARVAEHLVGRRVSVVGAVSEAEADLARRLGLRRVCVIHNGIPELDARDGPPTIGAENTTRDGVVAAGRMSSQRQPLAVADIFGALPRDVQRQWIGDSDAGVGAEALTRSGAQITGWLPRSRALALIRQARVYLHWTAWDGFPLSVLEAIALGTVVVGHDIPPVREILSPDWVTASARTAAQLIGRLLSDDDFYALAKRAQSAAAAPYSGRAMSDRWCRLYAELASAEGRC